MFVDKAKAAASETATFKWFNARGEELPDQTGNTAVVAFTDCRDDDRVRCQITVAGEMIEARITITPVGTFPAQIMIYMYTCICIYTCTPPPIHTQTETILT